MRAVTARKIRSPQPNDLKRKDTFQGPATHRGCTDVFFLVLSAAFLGGMIYVFYLSLFYGCPYRLLYGIDSWGNTCNLKNEKIPSVHYSGLDTTHLTYLFTYTNQSSHVEETVCVKECPRQIIRTQKELVNFTEETGSNLCRYDGSVCPTLPIAATIPLFHRCVPFENEINKVVRALNDDVFRKIAVDLETSWREIVYMGLLSIALSIIFLVIMRFLGEYIVWLVAVVVALTLLGLVIFCWYQYYALQRGDKAAVKVSKPADEPALWLFVSLFMSVVTVSQLFREAGKVVTDIPLLNLLPFVIFFIMFGVLSFLVYIYISIESSGNLVVEEKTHYVHLEEIKTLTYMKWYHIFGIFWIINFITSSRDFVISSSVAIWYFTRNRATLKHPVVLSIIRLTRYHLGSVLFGSLLIASASMFRLIMEVIDSRSKSRTNAVISFLTKCLRCCLWLYEKSIKFISKNAYTEMAIYGHNYCTSAKMAFYVILNNVLQLATINSVGDFLLFLGKIAVMAVCAIIGHELIMDCENLHYMWVPMLAICILTYFIASCFFSLYETTIDSLFVCFCEDHLINDGQSRPYFMNKGLMSYVKNSQAKMQALNKPTTSVQST
ncbi:choline transporter-like protein 1 isoform X2 [Octopus sinensis]|uniref:Choline transporter-like protein n=1 Tax=Octopus sinensis TaxID=2607531 RepID=A0A7E6FN10_9MOLL|nr:choline transporter-like protein 1 isoform X2 [Octopus sinensis]